MKKRLQIIALLFIFIMTATIGTGCAKKPAALEVVSKIPKLKLSISATSTGKELIDFKKTLETINLESSEYELELKEISNQGYMQELDSLINTNMAPDLIMLNYTNNLIQNGALLDITDYIGKDRDIKIANYYKSSIDSISANKKIYGLPFSCSPLVLLYNQNLFEDSGVALPKSGWKWDDFRNAAKQLTKDTDGDGKIDQWGYNHSYTINFVQFLNSYGAGVGGNKDNLIAAFNMYKNIFDEHLTPGNEDLDNFFKVYRDMPFNVGKAAMDIRTFDPAYNDSIMGNMDKIRIAEMPYGTDKSSLFFSRTLSIYSKTKNKDVAYKALSDTVLALQKGNFISPLKSGMDNSTYNKMNNLYEMTVLRNTLSYSKSFYMSDEASIAYNALNRAMLSLLYEGKTVEEAIKEAEERIKNRSMNNK